MSMLRAARSQVNPDPSTEDWQLYLTACSDLGHIPGDDEFTCWLAGYEGRYRDEAPEAELTGEYDPEPFDEQWYLDHVARW